MGRRLSNRAGDNSAAVDIELGAMSLTLQSGGEQHARGFDRSYCEITPIKFVHGFATIARRFDGLKLQRSRNGSVFT